MSQLAYFTYPNVYVEYKLINRSQERRLANRIAIDELQFELDNLPRKFTEEDIVFLAGTKLFNPIYLNWLRTIEFPKIDVKFEDNAFNNDISVEYEGKWPEAIFLETPILAVINELYHRGSSKVFGTERLLEKIEKLQTSRAKFVEFGTRRRFSARWQDTVVSVLTKAIPSNITGTSNVALAKKYDLPPVGTMAHQLFMVIAACEEHRLDWTQRTVLSTWHTLYGNNANMLTALTDTWGSDFFFENFRLHEAQRYKRLRQDSGSPELFANFALGFWTGAGIDPKDCTIIFSDGLDVDRILELDKKFSKRTNVLFGWGTDLTCDVGAKPLSIVIKPVRANGHPCVKLSDNIAKATGPKDSIELYKELVKYQSTFLEVPKY